jgi:hypothetical protein
MCLSDLGVKYGYNPSEEIETAVGHISAMDDAVDAVVLRYCRPPDANWANIDVELVFPLLDILLRVEDRTRTSTRAERAQLWDVWQGKFPFEMQTSYRSSLENYETEIRQ